MSAMNEIGIRSPLATRLAPQGLRPGEQAQAGAGSTGFLERLGEAIRSADRDQKAAESEARALAKGEGDVVETMIQLSRADLSLRFVVQMRNRALEAYNEIMRLPL